MSERVSKISKTSPFETLKGAIWNGTVDDVITLLLDTSKNLDVTFSNNFAIHWASQNGHLEVVKLLLEDERVDPSAGDNYAIRWASENGHFEVVKLLLEDERVDPGDKDNWAIQWASQKGHLEVVKLLIKDKSVDPSADNNWAIRMASENGHLEVVKLLIKDDRVDPSAQDNYAIGWASKKGQLEVVLILMCHGASLNNIYYFSIPKYLSRYENCQTMSKNFFKKLKSCNREKLAFLWFCWSKVGCAPCFRDLLSMVMTAIIRY